MENVFRGERADVFARYAPGLRPSLVPSDPLPAAARQRLATVLFPRLFPFLRRVVFDFASTERRKQFSAWVPLDAATDHHKQWKQTDAYLLKHYGFFYLASCLLYDWIRDSVACRRRAADDAGFLDSLALGVVLGPRITKWFRMEEAARKAVLNSFEGETALRTELTIPVGALMGCVSANLKPWLARGPFTGPATASALFFGVMSALATHGGYKEDNPDRNEACELSKYAFDCFVLAASVDDPKSDYMIRLKRWRSEEGTGEDVCDACGRDVEKLLRCARCRVGRFCDADCQKAAWVDGRHKSACLAITFPHPGGGN